jgi:hypothetical protein
MRRQFGLVSTYWSFGVDVLVLHLAHLAEALDPERAQRVAQARR